MQTREASPTAEKQLRAYRAEYDALKTRLQEIGFICTGSLVTRRTVCGKPTCRCNQGGAKRHGPYHQLTWKEEGVTVTRRLSPEHAQLYREWIANRRRLESLVAELQRVSGKAARHLLRRAGDVDPSSMPPAPRRRSRRRAKQHPGISR